MYILTIEQEQRDIQWLSFQTLESGRRFLSLLPGYRTETNGHFTQDWIRTNLFPDYEEISFNGNSIPVSKFMFKDWGEMEAYFTEIPNADIHNQGLINATTVVDAYAIPNSEMKDYIETREQAYLTIQKILREKNIEIDRAYHGSQDGEAILYRREGEQDWHILEHMDPSFVRLAEQGEHAVRNHLESLELL